MQISLPLQRFLAEMEYPATKNDLVREGEREGLPPDDLALLKQLDRCSYSARWQVASALRDISGRTLAAA